VEISKARKRGYCIQRLEDSLEKSDVAEDKFRWRLEKSAQLRIHVMDRNHLKRPIVVEKFLDRTAGIMCRGVRCTKKE